MLVLVLVLQLKFVFETSKFCSYPARSINWLSKRFNWLPNAAADKLIGIVSAESEKVKRERFTASEEEKRVRVIEEDVSIKTKLCEQDLRQAQPALVAAQAALNTLNKNNLTELKSFGSPPKAVMNVCAAVMVLLATNGKIPRDRSWKTAKLMMVRVDQFLSDLVNYNKDNIHPNIIETLQEYLKVQYLNYLIMIH